MTVILLACAITQAGGVRVPLGQTGGQVEIAGLITALQRGTVTERLAAVDRLAAAGPAAREAVPALVDALGDERIRLTVISALGRLASTARPAVPAVAALLARQPALPDYARRTVMEALGSIGGEEVLSPLIHGLCDEERWVADAAADALVTIGEPAIPALVAGLAVDCNDSPALTVGALSEIGPPAVVALTHALRDGRPRVVALAVDALGGIGRAAASAVPAIIALGDSSDRSLRYTIVLALKRVDPARGLPVFIRFVSDSEPIVCNAAIEAIAELGPGARSTERALDEALQHQSSETRAIAAGALGAIGAHSATTVSALRLCLRDPAASVREWSARSLGTMGASARAAIPDIEGMLGDPDQRTRQAARTALEALRGVK